MSPLHAARVRHLRHIVVLAALAAASPGCGDRMVPVVGIAMGADSLLPHDLLSTRQQRFNDSVGSRHQVRLRLGPAGLETGVNAGLSWASELVRTPGIVGVVGHESSRSSLQAASLYGERGIVQIVPTGTSGELATVSPWTFPLVASDASQGERLARHLVAMESKRATLFVQDDEYGRGIMKSLRGALNGTSVLVLESVMQTPDSDLELLVQSVLTHSPVPDALVLVTQGGIAQAIARLSWARLPSLLILASDAANDGARVLRSLAPAPDRLALATYWLPDSTDAATQAFLRDFRNSEHWGEPQWNHAAYYDAVGMLTAAAAQVGPNPKAVRDWLLSLGRTRPSYVGVLGSIDFTGTHPIPALLMRPSATGWELVK